MSKRLEVLEALEIIGNINLGSNPYCVFEKDLLKNCEAYNIIINRLEKLEKAIDILKDKFELELINEELHFNTYECDTREIHELYDEWFYNLTKEEFDLLKEVLKNDC